MLIKRVVIASDLAFRFFSRPAAITVAALPIVLWPLKRLFFARTSLTEDVIVLLIVYVVIAMSVLAWKFIEAEHVIDNEPKLYADLQKLDAQEQNELRRLVRSGRMSIGPPLLERIRAKTDFIYRDLSGEWRIEREYRRFLKHWDKTNDT
jgi:hypothetical protein